MGSRQGERWPLGVGGYVEIRVLMEVTSPPLEDRFCLDTATDSPTQDAEWEMGTEDQSEPLGRQVEEPIRYR